MSTKPQLPEQLVPEQLDAAREVIDESLEPVPDDAETPKKKTTPADP